MLSKIFSRTESFQKISTLDPATIFSLSHLIRSAFCTHYTLPSPPPPLPLACRLKQSVHIKTFVESSVWVGSCCSGRLLRKGEKGFLLSPPDILGHPYGGVCLPSSELVTETFAPLWKANVPGKCKFQAVTLIYTL